MPLIPSRLRRREGARRPRNGRRSPWASVALLLVGLIATGTLSMLATGPSPASAAEAAQVEAEVEEGRRLYLANCATCHGTNLQGGTDGPALIGVGEAAVDFQVGTGRMPLRQHGPQAPRGQLVYTDEQIRQLAAYIGRFGPGPGIPTAEQLRYDNLSDTDIALGGEIYRTNCAMCHNASGSGGALTGGKYAPSLEGVAPKYIYEALVTGPQSMPVFADVALDELDKRRVIGYLKAIESEPDVGGADLGGLGPLTEGLAAWIVGIGGLIGVAVWLGAKSS